MALDLFATAARLSDCIGESLRAPRDGCDSWEGDVCVYPGQVPFDSCCEGGGLAWVTIESGSAVTSFPFGDNGNSAASCSLHTQAVAFEVGVLRCICTEDCDCDQIEVDAAAVYSDLQALLRGATCCFTEEDDPDWRLLGWDIIGPEGGCSGARVRLLVEQPFPCC